MATSRLFTPLTVGNMKLAHRVAMGPLTRFRADDDHVPVAVMEEYYSQRSSVPGTLIVTEGTFISVKAGGYRNVPGIYNEQQIEAWKKITDVVHKNGSYIFCQLWGLGRAASAEVAREEGFDIRAPSAIPVDSESPLPLEMTQEDIEARIQDYAQAAKNAIAAGFDGVEIHGANGYLVDQFIEDVTNQRTDQYGGSIENRSRFGLEVVKAVVDAVGPKRTAIRLSPWSTFNNMRMANPVPQFTHFIKGLAQWDLAYLHVVESRVTGNADIESTDELDFAVDAWPGVLLIAGGYKSESAKRLVDEERPNRNVVVIFGRYFISNPDLPFRIEQDLPLNPYNRDTFYIPKSTAGYIDYEFSPEFVRVQG